MKSHYPRKRFGQHFLHDAAVIQKIISVVAPRPDDCLVEIGPGLGALTRPLSAQVNTLVAIELDRDLIPKLKQVVDSAGLIIHQADALRFDFKQLFKGKPLRLIGNLPYNISTPLLFHLLENMPILQDMYFMLQKEVVERIVAQPGSQAYGRLSVMIQYPCHVEKLFAVPASAFSPEPQVDSAFLRLVPHKKIAYPAANTQLFSEVVKTAFNQRRKTLRNSLRPWLDANQLEALGVNPQQRPERLTIQEYVKIANWVSARD